MIARAYRHPRPSWLHDNYFHDPVDDDWIRSLGALVQSRRAGELAPRPAPERRGGALRDAWERKRALGGHDRSGIGLVALVIGTPARAFARTAQALGAAARSSVGTGSAVRA